jgi:hypothetical protein
MNNQVSDEEIRKGKKVVTIPRKYPKHYPDSAWVISKLIDTIKKLLKRG